MRKLVKYLLLVLLLGSAPGLHAYSELVILGDSLSDTGNHPAALLGTPYPYYKNRISNGPVAVDVLAQLLGLSADHSGYLFANGSGGNYAVSGANASGTEIHDLSKQLSAMLADRSTRLDDQALYLLIIGGNDIRDASVLDSYVQGVHAVNQAADSIRAAVQQLMARGAKSILVSNAPDISVIPETAERAKTNTGLVNRAAQLSRDFNLRLKQQLDALSLSKGRRIMRYDFYGQFNNIVKNSSKYGFSNANEACFEHSPYSFHPQCDFNKFVFFDSIHPTAKSHELLGQGLADVALERNSSAIPAMLLLLLN